MESAISYTSDEGPINIINLDFVRPLLKIGRF